MNCSPAEVALSAAVIRGPALGKMGRHQRPAAATRRQAVAKHRIKSPKAALLREAEAAQAIGVGATEEEDAV